MSDLCSFLHFLLSHYFSCIYLQVNISATNGRQLWEMPLLHLCCPLWPEGKGLSPQTLPDMQPCGDVSRRCCCIIANKFDSGVRSNKVQLDSNLSHPLCLSVGDEVGLCTQLSRKMLRRHSVFLVFGWFCRHCICKIWGRIYGLPQFSCPGQTSSGRELNCR